jgi:predicted DNA-binding transcriptional regulator YafY
MPANKYALLRYRIIDRCLTNKARPFPTKEDLRQACEDALYGSDGDQISESTIEKDLWAMRNEGELGFYAPISYSKAHKGYFYDDPNYTINDINLGDEDLDALYFAADTLTQFRDIPLFRSYRSAIDKVVSKLRVNRDPNSRESEAYIQFEDAPEVQGLDQLEPLASAIKDRALVELAYMKFTDEQVAHHTLEPYLLKEYRNRWYLIGRQVSKNEIRTYGLDRIRSVERTGAQFSPSEEFDSDAFFRHSIGITQIDTKPTKVVLKCDPVQAKYLQSRPMHRSQQLNFDHDGYGLLRMEVIITFELVQEILGYGKAVEVLEPEALRNRLTEELRAALAQYD